jgi:hypothetical protein
LYLILELNIFDESYFFFDALSPDIESIRVVDNIRDNTLKGYDETTYSEADFNIDSRVFLENLEG